MHTCAECKFVDVVGNFDTARKFGCNRYPRTIQQTPSINFHPSQVKACGEFQPVVVDTKTTSRSK
jgi:hypothetical protein